MTVRAGDGDQPLRCTGEGHVEKPGLFVFGLGLCLPPPCLWTALAGFCLVQCHMEPPVCIMVEEGCLQIIILWNRHDDDGELQALGDMDRHDFHGVALALQFAGVFLRFLLGALVPRKVDALGHPVDKDFRRRSPFADGGSREIDNLEHVRKHPLPVRHLGEPSTQIAPWMALQRGERRREPVLDPCAVHFGKSAD